MKFAIALVIFNALILVSMVLRWIQVISSRQRIEELEKQNAALQEAKFARDKADYDAKVAAILK